MEFSSGMLSPMYALWLTVTWTIENVLGIGILGHIISIGKEARVEDVVYWG